jgi:hypothetical protein
MAQATILVKPAPPRPWVLGGPEHPARESDVKWDPLLLWIAGYILTSVGRVHQLFSALEPLHLALLTGIVAIGMYLFDPLEPRRSIHVLVPTTKYVVGLVIWMAMSVPVALHVGNSFELLFNNFFKTALMYVIVAASVRGVRDVERLAGVYLVAAVTYSGVVLSRFDVGAGDAWRLGRLYYYDANDFATFVVTAVPIGLYFLHAGRRRARGSSRRSRSPCSRSRSSGRDRGVASWPSSPWAATSCCGTPRLPCAGVSRPWPWSRWHWSGRPAVSTGSR